jgi:uncharacterized protein (DUF4415 family)
MKTKLSPELQKQADELAAMPDEDIDTQDIPEAPADAWKHARRPDFYRPLKKTVTLRLDMDVLAWFKDRTERGYQTEMNRVLRKYMIEAENQK